MERLLVRPSEGAEMLAVSRARFYQLLASGVIPSVTLGRSRRIAYADLSTLVERLRGGETLDDLARELPTPPPHTRLAEVPS